MHMVHGITTGYYHCPLHCVARQTAGITQWTHADHRWNLVNYVDSLLAADSNAEYTQTGAIAPVRKKKLFTLFFLFEGQTDHFRGMAPNVLWIRQRKYVWPCKNATFMIFFQVLLGGGQNICWPPFQAFGRVHGRIAPPWIRQWPRSHQRVRYRLPMGVWCNRVFV